MELLGNLDFPVEPREESDVCSALSWWFDDGEPLDVDAFPFWLSLSEEVEVFPVEGDEPEGDRRWFRELPLPVPFPELFGWARFKAFFHHGSASEGEG